MVKATSTGVIPIAKPLTGPEEAAAVAEVLASGWLTQGPKVAEFERTLAGYLGVQEAVATSNCTTALQLALELMGVGRGDEVIVPSLSFIATANAVIHAGGTPVFADVSPGALNIDPAKLEAAITSRTKVIMPVHQVGLAADVVAIAEIARARDLTVLEDAACALGAKDHHGRHVPLGDTACLSFHPRKSISTGEGGMIVTNDRKLAAQARELRSHGMSLDDLARHAAGGLQTERYERFGYNFRMSDLNAAVGIEQMKRLHWILQRRREIAARYDAAFSAAPGVEPPLVPTGYVHSYQSYVVTVTDAAARSRDEARKFLLGRGVATRNGVMAIHREPAYQDYVRTPLPETDRMADISMVIPLFPQMTDAEVQRVIDSLLEAVSG